MKPEKNDLQPAVIHFDYEGNPITFTMDETIMVNATEMAKPFDKKAIDWLKNQSTQEFLDELSKLRILNLDDLVQTVKGGTDPGTWFHKDVAIEFARWLSPRFSIWCNDRIIELLTKRQVSMSDKNSVQMIPAGLDIVNAIIYMQKEINEFHSRVKNVEEEQRIMNTQLEDFFERIDHSDYFSYYDGLVSDYKHLKEVAEDRKKMIGFYEEKGKKKDEEINQIKREFEKKDMQYKKDVKKLETHLEEKERTIQLLMKKQS